MTKPRTNQEREDARRLGETSDERGRTTERDPNVEMTEGQDLAVTNPDVATEAPSGMGRDEPAEIDRGFADDRERRD